MAVVVELTSDEQRLLKGLQKLTAQQQRVERGFKDIRDKGKQAGEQTAETFDVAGIEKYVASLGVATAAFAAMRLAAAGVRAEIDQIITRQREAAGTQVPLSSTRQGVLRNLVGVDEQEKSRILAALPAIALQTGVPEASINAAAAQAISASGGRPQAALDAVRRSARFAPDEPGAIPQLAGSLLDLAKVTGTTDPRINQGLLAFVASQSRVVSPQLQAANIPRSLINQIPFGSTPAEAAALFSTLTVAGADTKGEASGTASINLARRLRDFFREGPRQRAALDQQLAAAAEAGDLDAFGAIEAKLAAIPELPAATTTGARIRALQGDPALAERFLAKNTFEVKAQGVIEDLLLNPKSEAARLFTTQLGSLPSTEGLGKIADEVLGSRRLDPLDTVAGLNRLFDVSVEQLRARDPLQGIAGIARQRLPEVLRAAGRGGIGERLDTVFRELQTNFGRGDVLGNAIGEIADIESAIRPGVTRSVEPVVGPGGGLFGPFEGRSTPRPLTESEQDLKALLRGILDELRKIRASSTPPALAPVNDDPRGN